MLIGNYNFTVFPILSDFLTMTRTDGSSYTIEAQPLAEAVVGGSFVRSPVAANPVVGLGFIPFEYASDLIYERIWVPELLSLGYILSNYIEEVEIWNATGQSVQITAIGESGDEGLFLDEPSLPATIDPDELLVLDLYVYRLGPAQQQAVYTFTIDGSDYELSVVGVRSVALYLEPEWKRGIAMSYAFETVVAESKQFKEQRRPLISKLIRNERVSYQLMDVESQKFFNLISLAHDKGFAIPIFSEPMLASTITQGGSSITITTPADISDYWNINNQADHIIIVDWENDIFETKNISSVSGQLLNLLNPIENDYTEISTTIYPVFIGYLKASRGRSLTDSVDEYSIEITEL